MANTPPINVSRYRSAVISALFLIFGWLIVVDTVWAHKVTIFAWIEGDTVYTQSKFSGGKRVINSQVIVYDMDKNQLLEGQTDDNGEFSFKVPPQASSGLKVVLNSSMGHMAEWTIPADEISDAGNRVEGSQPSAVESKIQVDALAPDQPSHAKTTPTPSVIPPDDSQGCNDQRIEVMIERALDKKLTPIMSMLIESLDRRPKAQDIIGGIGYIVGLVGLAMYFLARKKEK